MIFGWQSVLFLAFNTALSRLGVIPSRNARSLSFRSDRALVQAWRLMLIGMFINVRFIKIVSLLFYLYCATDEGALTELIPGITFYSIVMNHKLYACLVRESEFAGDFMRQGCSSRHKMTGSMGSVNHPRKNMRRK